MDNPRIYAINSTAYDRRVVLDIGGPVGARTLREIEGVASCQVTGRTVARIELEPDQSWDDVAPRVMIAVAGALGIELDELNPIDLTGLGGVPMRGAIEAAKLFLEEASA